jgi:ribosome maturation factor RimP
MKKEKVVGPRPLDLKLHFVEYRNKIADVTTKSGKKLSGRVIEISDPFLVIEHRDGRHSRIRFSEIGVIFEVGQPYQNGV